MQLYGFQEPIKEKVYEAWRSGAKATCVQLATGGGKTVIFSSIIHDLADQPSVAIAHRKELVGQMSLALGREGVKHRIIAPKPIVRMIVQEQMRELGRVWFDPNARSAVAGVNTLVNRAEALNRWMQQVKVWIQDEGHHVLRNNIWGKAVALFPNAVGAGFTATPTRADGRGLGRHADGVYDTLIEGPQYRWLIDNGYLSDYRIICAQTHIDLTNVPVSEETGDFVQKKLKKALRDSPIVGDVVAAYLQYAPGKLAVCFATDVETACDIAKKFNVAGVKAEVVSAETPDALRNDIIRKFRNGQVRVLVNVDLFGEGFNLPALECVIFARPTMSYALYCQQFGRGLRVMLGKDKAIIIDHVGNFILHGPPDRPRLWTLDARPGASRGKQPDELALRVCPACAQPYERFYAACPYCGFKPVPSARSNPEFVDGDLLELDAETLAKMRGEIAAIDETGNNTAHSMSYAGAPKIAINGFLKNHKLRQDAQGALRESIAWWAGWQKQQGRSDSETYRRFYLKYGIDILSAQTLGRPEALELADRINRYIGEFT